MKPAGDRARPAAGVSTLTAAPGFLEVELKLALPASQAERLRRHPALRAISPHRAVVAELDAIYFDTPTLALQARGVAVRLRQAGGQWVQTVKTRGDATGALHQRLEWEVPSDGLHLDFDSVSDPAVRNFLKHAANQQGLQPLFRTRFRRWARLLVLPDGTQIELALDLGAVEAGGHQDPISEVELELKHGASRSLFALALALQDDLDLHPEQRSKAQRGYALALGITQSPKRARPPVLSRHLTVAQACAGFLGAAQQQWQDNLAGACLGDNPEYLHQVRVALRRLRAALAVFRGVLPASVLLALRQESRWLMQALGAARDWDVLVTETLPGVQAALPDQPGLAALLPLAEQQRVMAHAQALQALTSRRAARLALQLGEASCALMDQREASSAPLPADTDRAQSSAAGDERLDQFAVRILRKRARRAHMNASDLLALDVAGRHAWRIVLKKLRYTGDFLLPVFGHRRRARRWITALSSLQSILGSMNDAATTHRLIETLLLQPGAPREAAALARGFVEGTSQTHLRQLEAARRVLARTAAPWQR